MLECMLEHTPIWLSCDLHKKHVLIKSSLQVLMTVDALHEKIQGRSMKHRSRSAGG